MSDKMRRRDFLARSSVGVVALSAPRFAAGTVSKRYRVGVIGVTGRGGFGHEVDRAWLDFEECDVVAVADPDSRGRQRVAARLKAAQSFADYRKMLDDAKPDIVSICQTFIDQHRDMAVAAAERGIHVYMEKPFCPNLRQCDDVVRACEKHGVKFALALPTAFSPKMQMAKKLIADGAIGKVLEYRGRGKEDGRGGGEDLWVLGTHVMDMIRSIGGHPKWCFADVTAKGEPIEKRHITTGKNGITYLAGDAVRAMYGMPGDATAHFHSYKDMRGDPWRYGLQVFGSKGIIEIQEGPLADVKYLGDPSWCPGRSGAKWQDVSSAGIGKPEPLGALYRHRHYAAIRNFLNAIENDEKTLCDADDARGATEMVAAVFESHRTRSPVPLPLETREDPLGLF